MLGKIDHVTRPLESSSFNWLRLLTMYCDTQKIIVWNVFLGCSWDTLDFLAQRNCITVWAWKAIIWMKRGYNVLFAAGTNEALYAFSARFIFHPKKNNLYTLSLSIFSLSLSFSRSVSLSLSLSLSFSLSISLKSISISLSFYVYIYKYRKKMAPQPIFVFFFFFLFE